MPFNDNVAKNAYRQLLNKLNQNGAITDEMLRASTFGQPIKIIDLLANKTVTEDDILRAGVGIEGLSEPIVIASDMTPEQDALLHISGVVARREKVLPYKVVPERQALQVIIPLARINDIQLRDDIKAQARPYSAEFLLSSTMDLSQSVEKAYRAEGELRQLSRAQNEKDIKAKSEAVVEDIVEETPETRFVELILDQAINDGASDIHIEQTETKLIVRFRLDGVLRDISDNTPKSMAPGIISRIKILANLDIAERRKPQDGRLSRMHGKRGKIDFRVAILPTVMGEKIIMRILDNSQASMQLGDLGFSEANRKRFEESYSLPHGMILVTGPTGSGKSTTLYAALNALVSPEINIITVEDPVEYRIERINQVQVNVKAGLTFAGALRSILRADPDVVLIGEIRDAETAHIAVEAAQTGHLVLSTLHTNDAPSAIGRLADLGVEPFLIGTTVNTVLAQRLVRRLCKRCKEAYTPDVEELQHIGYSLYVPGMPAPTLYRPVGCKECAHTGYKGRVAVHEVMSVSEKIQKLIIRGEDAVGIAAEAQGEGMKTLREDGWTKVESGLTSIAEILRIAG